MNLKSKDRKKGKKRKFRLKSEWSRGIHASLSNEFDDVEGRECGSPAAQNMTVWF